jgi:hypothetical protein
VPVLPSEGSHQLLVLYGFRIGKLLLDFAGALQRVSEPAAETQASVLAGLEYFWRKRSTRPAVSTSFCLPVKNGWHCAQMSVWISAWVERVWYVFPHAQRTVAVAYVGWISGFISGSKGNCWIALKYNELA